MDKATNRAIFSDVDGTLSKGFVTVDFIRFLNSKGLISAKAYNLHEKLMQEYKAKKIRYIDLVPKWSKSVSHCLKGLRVSNTKILAKQFFTTWKSSNIFLSTIPLVKMTRERGYKFFLISAGWDELVKLFDKEIGADGFVGMKVGVTNEKYNGELKTKVHFEIGKAQEIDKLIRKFDIDRNRTMGFGDSIQDKAIFESVKKPVALNPSQELRKKAIKERWFIANHENILQVMTDCFEKRKNP
jgi:HAD superfamily hydrolase (TIGR01490 family)